VGIVEGEVLEGDRWEGFQFGSQRLADGGQVEKFALSRAESQRLQRLHLLVVVFGQGQAWQHTGNIIDLIVMLRTKTHASHLSNCLKPVNELQIPPTHP
jgi:hypothetical protein